MEGNKNEMKMKNERGIKKGKMRMKTKRNKEEQKRNEGNESEIMKDERKRK